jgi:hypothetical protein
VERESGDHCAKEIAIFWFFMVDIGIYCGLVVGWCIYVTTAGNATRGYDNDGC